MYADKHFSSSLALSRFGDCKALFLNGKTVSKSVSRLFHRTILPLCDHSILNTKVRQKKMKNLKIITTATVAMVAAVLLISSVAAMPVGHNSNSAYGGMMGGYSHAQSTPATQNHQFGASFSFGHMMSWFGNGFSQMMRCLRL